MASKETKTARSLAAVVAIALVQARVLVDHEPLGLKVGHIAEGTQSQIDSLHVGGIVDPHPDAVAYALGEGARVVSLPGAEAAAAAAQAQVPAPDGAAAPDAGADVAAASTASTDSAEGAAAAQGAAPAA